MPADRRLLPVQGDWAAMRAGFRWPRPERFNIAERCCDSWARAEPDRLALTHLDGAGGRRDWTYGQLKAASDRLANAFAARGIGRGDRVAVLLAQSPEVMIAHFAAQKLGAVVLPLFTLFGADALAFRLADSGAKALVTDPETVERVLAGELTPHAPNTVVDPARLRTELEEVRRTGTARTQEEMSVGTCSVAAPVRGAGGRVVAALSLVAWRHTADPRRLAPAVLSAAAALSRDLAAAPR
jgi:acyl-coenzyme A synthetase/AMP-(fatty) acid ligase